MSKKTLARLPSNVYVAKIVDLKQLSRKERKHAILIEVQVNETHSYETIDITENVYASKIYGESPVRITHKRLGIMQDLLIGTIVYVISLDDDKSYLLRDDFTETYLKAENH